MKRYLVERELIQNNIQVLQKKAGSAVIWAVLKGNGYGEHGEPVLKVRYPKFHIRWRRPAARQVSITLR